jgi:hypothetical protein
LPHHIRRGQIRSREFWAVGVGCSTLVQVVKNNVLRHCQSRPSSGSETARGYANAIESNAAVQTSAATAIAKILGFRHVGVIDVTPDRLRRSIGPSRSIACEPIHSPEKGFLSRNKRFGRNARVPIKHFLTSRGRRMQIMADNGVASGRDALYTASNRTRDCFERRSEVKAPHNIRQKKVTRLAQ